MQRRIEYLVMLHLPFGGGLDGGCNTVALVSEKQPRNRLVQVGCMSDWLSCDMSICLREEEVALMLWKCYRLIISYPSRHGCTRRRRRKKNIELAAALRHNAII